MTLPESPYPKQVEADRVVAFIALITMLAVGHHFIKVFTTSEIEDVLNDTEQEDTGPKTLFENN